jgi:DNA-binding GntR family transcriptional regulator
MTGGELPESVRSLIASSIPTLDALEILLLLVRRHDEALKPEQIEAALRPTEVAVQRIGEYLGLLEARGLVVEEPGRGFQFRPKSPELADATAALSRAYHERPVTLVRTVYQLAEANRLRDWADSFRFKKDG